MHCITGEYTYLSLSQFFELYWGYNNHNGPLAGLSLRWVMRNQVFEGNVCIYLALIISAMGASEAPSLGGRVKNDYKKNI